MLDSFNREINYLRISVTDRCNLNCFYCKPGNFQEFSPGDILTFEEILEVVQAFLPLGLKKVRITGGEPLVRKNLLYLIENIAALPGIDDLALTTNGILFPRYAQDLKSAGLSRVNFSLDSLNPDKFRSITGGGELKNVLEAINLALELDLTPVKINTVLLRGINLDEIDAFVDFIFRYPVHWRFIELMPLNDREKWQRQFVSVKEILEIISAKYKLIPGKTVGGAGPARYYEVPGALGTIGVISPLSNHFCEYCNRLRLTSTGKLRLCLAKNQEVDIKSLLRSGISQEELTGVLREAILRKPRAHEFGDKDFLGTMANIGG
ncbi:GTP 3',8-cyclase MoaA [Carboxydothermus ferrireducens]|uniref:GTP 3',8-cyclase n=1 Tax=Carboxydothermus ferrireducens DSM 11255 TaxID=1119529 RepID=A0ABX2R967_9THEO|nr:GTP 3',8-cyclase MoaA [Carboxydothermus ferrireducens]NYE56681.1 cyclic pyranopterin phosphate synthase [Carboxydothermus ferrireducens DSM 11255]